MNQSELKEIKAIVWSDYSDLDYWISEMNRNDAQQIPKHVLKMAMKHLRDDFSVVHAFLTRYAITDDDLKGS